VLYFIPFAVFVCAPALFLFGAMELFVDVLASWNQDQQQKYWNLWQICLALRSRRPLPEEVDFLSHYSWGRHRRRLRDMAEQLQEGAEPSDVFIHPSLLSRLEGAQVATGLKTGRLSEVLIEMQQRRSEFLTNVLQVHKPVISMLYPWAVVLTLTAVAGFVNHYIMPKFKKIFDDFGVELPAITKTMLSTADTFLSVWYLGSPVLLIALICLTFLAFLPFASGHPGLREALTRIWPRICIPDILRTLAHAVRANVPLEEALAPLVRRQLRIPLHNRLVRVQEAVREGHDCWAELAGCGLLTRREAAVLQSAQLAGNLPWALETVSRRFEQSWRFRLLFCFEWIQPLLVISIGCFVAFFAFACFLPLVKILVDLS
jgi:type IV pilus assembly protein PilC